MSLLTSIAVRGAAAAARQILQLEDQRTRQLAQLAAAVQAGLEGPYRSGIEHLRIAATVDTTAPSAAGHLVSAEELFVQAYGNLKEVDPLLSAWAAVQLVVICLATGRQNEGLHWARLGHQRAVRAAELQHRQLTDRADGKVGRLKLTSEGTSGSVQLAGGAATGLAAAAAGITIATGGLGLVAIGAGLGASLAAGKALDMYRERGLRVRAAKEKEISAFVDDLVELRRRLGDDVTADP